MFAQAGVKSPIGKRSGAMNTPNLPPSDPHPIAASIDEHVKMAAWYEFIFGALPEVAATKLVALGCAQL